MPSTLGQMRTLVRELLDDVSDDAEELYWSDTAIDFALGAALEGVLAALAPSSDRFDVHEDVTVTSGLAALSSLPLLVKGVAWRAGHVLVPLEAATFAATSWTNASGELRVTYVPRPELPNDASDPVLYGAGPAATSKIVDRLVALEAAASLKPREGEANQVLERERAHAWDVAREASSAGPRSREISFGARGWSETAYTSGPWTSYRWVYDVATGSVGLVL